MQEQSFALAVDDITQRINDRMGAYETALRGMSGVFASSQQVSPEEWQRAVAQLQLQARVSPARQGESSMQADLAATLAPWSSQPLQSAHATLRAQLFSMR